MVEVITKCTVSWFDGEHVAVNSQPVDNHTSQSQYHHATTVRSKVKAFGACEHCNSELNKEEHCNSELNKEDRVEETPDYTSSSAPFSARY